MEELKIISILLFVTIFSFIIISLVQLSVQGVGKFNPEFNGGNAFEPFHRDYYVPKASVKLISALSVIFVAYGCQQNLFPIFSELKNKTTRELVVSFSWACTMVGVLYVTLAIISIYMYGSDIRLETSVLKNVGEQCTEDDCPWESIVLRMMFMVVIACHIPFLFFSGKEGTLIIIDELDRQSISKALQFKLNVLAEDQDETVQPLIERDLRSALDSIKTNGDGMIRDGKSEVMHVNKLSNNVKSQVSE